MNEETLAHDEEEDVNEVKNSKPIAKYTGRRAKKKMKRDENRKVKEFCNDFARSGSCAFGAERCKFNHDYDTFFGALNAFYTAQKVSRDALQQVVTPATSPFELPPPPFHRSYATAPGEETSVVIHVHNNCVLAICLAPDHPFMVRGKTSVKSIQFTNHTNLRTGDMLLSITANDDVSFLVKTPLPGLLLEANEKLLHSPKLILDDPLHTGFLALFKAANPYPLLLPRYFRLIAVANDAENEDECGAD